MEKGKEVLAEEVKGWTQAKLRVWLRGGKIAGRKLGRRWLVRVYSDGSPMFKGVIREVGDGEHE